MGVLEPVKLISFEDMQGCMAAAYEWADSYDSKDWDRLSKCIAPTLRIDYRSFLNKIWEAMPAAEDAALHWWHQVGEGQRRRDHRLPPAACAAPEVHRCVDEQGPCQGSCAQRQHPLVQEGQWCLEVRRSLPGHQMVRVRFRQGFRQRSRQLRRGGSSAGEWRPAQGLKHV